MNFLIQTFEGKIKHDFSFNLIKAIEFQEWKGEKIDYQLTDDEYEEGFIPIGSVEFVSKYLDKFHKKTPKPKNIPEELFKYAKRNVFNGTEEDFWGKGKKFVKSNLFIKYPINGILNSETYDLPIGLYQYSDIIDIESEWRAFIHKNELVGLQNYLGDFTKFPDIFLIKDIIKNYEEAPISYTLDVGVNDNGTFIIEIHDFFSCGLYGFEDLSILPYMFSQWFYEFIRT